MVEFKLSFAESVYSNIPLMFGGVKCPFWKFRMKIFIEAIDRGIWDAIMNGPYVHTHVIDNKLVEKPCVV